MLPLEELLVLPPPVPELDVDELPLLVVPVVVVPVVVVPLDAVLVPPAPVPATSDPQSLVHAAKRLHPARSASAVLGPIRQACLGVRAGDIRTSLR